MLPYGLPLFISFLGLFTSYAQAELIAPSDVTATAAGPATIALSWTDNETTEDHYVVQRDDAGWMTIATLPANTTHYYDRGLGLSVTKNYRIQATNTTIPDFSAAVESGSATTFSFKPNVIFFLADDMGYKDIVALRNEVIDGPTLHETPALDTLAAESISFNNAYCSGPRCVVARRSIQTGQYDWRPGVVPSNDWYLDHDGDPIGGGLFAGGVSINPSNPGATIADNETYGEAVNAAGYRTCFIGKYHLGESPSDTPVIGYSFGDQPARGPDAQGYDVSIAAGHAGAPPSSYFAVENQHDLGNYTFELPDLDDANYGTSAPVAGEYITDRMTDKAIGFIQDVVDNFDSQPFHLTLAHYAVHTPMEAQPNAIAPAGKGYEYFQAKKTGMAADFAAHPGGATGLITDYSVKTRIHQDNAVYAAMMKSYDNSLAELRAYLAVTDDPRNVGMKLSDTTIIVVSSDHGGKSTTPIADNKTLEDDGVDTVNPAPTYDAGSGVYMSGTPNAYSSYPTSNYPYRQGKTWVYEGGLKVPLIVHIPWLTAAGGTTDAFVNHTDLFASFVDMAGGTQSTESKDSVSFMLPVTQPQVAARDELFHFFTNANKGTGNPAIGAYRRGDYKLLYFMVQRKVELYNLVADPYERNDLATSRPDLAAEMFDALYQEVLDSELKMPKPGSNTWSSEQDDVLVRNGVIGSLPAVPDADPTWVGAGATQISRTTIELNWQVNASNATHSVVYRRADAEGEDSYREHAYLPVGITTFRDTDLVSGGQYRYRVESENLGGWSTNDTGNKSLTLVDPGPGNLVLVAGDDSITTVPGEVREFNPLLNDEGEGALTITAVTSPTKGSATFDGQSITYQAPEGFAGSVTMTYTVTDAAAQTDTATVSFTLPVSNSTSGIERWDYDDATAVRIGSTASDNGILFSDISSDSVLTDGSDHLVFSVATGIGNSSKNTTTSVSGAPYTTGKYRLEYTIDSADLTNSAEDLAIGYAFRDNSASVSQKDLGLLRIRKVSDGASGSEIHLQLQVHNGTGFSVATLYDFNSLVISDVKVAMEVDLDVSPVTIESFISLNGAEFQSLGVNDANPNTSSFDRLKIQSNLTGMVSPDEVRIDYLELSEVVAAPSLYSAWATAYPWMGILDRDPSDDADFDGTSNFMEFALGTAPNIASSSPVEVGASEGVPVVRFTPARDAEAVQYVLQFSTDLSDWSTIPEVLVATSAGIEVEEALPAGGRGFSRIAVSE